MATLLNYSSINHIKSVSTETISETNTKDKEQTTSFQSNFIEKLKSVANSVKATVNSTKEIARSTLDFINTNFTKQINKIFNLFKTNEPTSPQPEAKTVQRQKPIDNKEIKSYINEQIEKLEISSQGEKDSKYAEQTIDSILASVYSQRKDAFCMAQLNSQHKIPEGYLREIGEVAQECGLTGVEDKGIFKPSGAGANPFLTAVMTPVKKKYAHRLLNRNQQTLFLNYAKTKIYDEIGKLCDTYGRINPSDFNARLEGIARKYTPMAAPAA